MSAAVAHAPLACPPQLAGVMPIALALRMLESIEAGEGKPASNKKRLLEKQSEQGPPSARSRSDGAGPSRQPPSADDLVGSLENQGSNEREELMAEALHAQSACMSAYRRGSSSQTAGAPLQSTNAVGALNGERIVTAWDLDVAMGEAAAEDAGVTYYALFGSDNGSGDGSGDGLDTERPASGQPGPSGSSGAPPEDSSGYSSGSDGWSQWDAASSEEDDTAPSLERRGASLRRVKRYKRTSLAMTEATRQISDNVVREQRREALSFFYSIVEKTSAAGSREDDTFGLQMYASLAVVYPGLEEVVLQNISLPLNPGQSAQERAADERRVESDKARFRADVGRQRQFHENRVRELLEKNKSVSVTFYDYELLVRESLSVFKLLQSKLSELELEGRKAVEYVDDAGGPQAGDDETYKNIARLKSEVESLELISQKLTRDAELMLFSVKMVVAAQSTDTTSGGASDSGVDWSETLKEMRDEKLAIRESLSEKFELGVSAAVARVVDAIDDRLNGFQGVPPELDFLEAPEFREKGAMRTKLAYCELFNFVNSFKIKRDSGGNIVSENQSLRRVVDGDTAELLRVRQRYEELRAAYDRENETFNRVKQELKDSIKQSTEELKGHERALEEAEQAWLQCAQSQLEMEEEFTARFPEEIMAELERMQSRGEALPEEQRDVLYAYRRARTSLNEKELECTKLLVRVDYETNMANYRKGRLQQANQNYQSYWFAKITAQELNRQRTCTSAIVFDSFEPKAAKTAKSSGLYMQKKMEDHKYSVENACKLLRIVANNYRSGTGRRSVMEAWHGDGRALPFPSPSDLQVYFEPKRGMTATWRLSGSPPTGALETELRRYYDLFKKVSEKRNALKTLLEKSLPLSNQEKDDGLQCYSDSFGPEEADGDAKSANLRAGVDSKQAMLTPEGVKALELGVADEVDFELAMKRRIEIDAIKQAQDGEANEDERQRFLVFDFMVSLAEITEFATSSTRASHYLRLVCAELRSAFPNDGASTEQQPEEAPNESESSTQRESENTGASNPSASTGEECSVDAGRLMGMLTTNEEWISLYERNCVAFAKLSHILNMWAKLPLNRRVGSKSPGRAGLRAVQELAERDAENNLPFVDDITDEILVVTELDARFNRLFGNQKLVEFNHVYSDRDCEAGGALRKSRRRATPVSWAAVKCDGRECLCPMDDKLQVVRASKLATAGEASRFALHLPSVDSLSRAAAGMAVPPHPNVLLAALPVWPGCESAAAPEPPYLASGSALDVAARRSANLVYAKLRYVRIFNEAMNELQRALEREYDRGVAVGSRSLQDALEYASADGLDPFGPGVNYLLASVGAGPEGGTRIPMQLFSASGVQAQSEIIKTFKSIERLKRNAVSDIQQIAGLSSAWSGPHVGVVEEAAMRGFGDEAQDAFTEALIRSTPSAASGGAESYDALASRDRWVNDSAQRGRAVAAISRFMHEYYGISEYDATLSNDESGTRALESFLDWLAGIEGAGGAPKREMATSLKLVGPDFEYTVNEVQLGGVVILADFRDARVKVDAAATPPRLIPFRKVELQKNTDFYTALEQRKKLSGRVGRARKSKYAESKAVESKLSRELVRHGVSLDRALNSELLWRSKRDLYGYLKRCLGTQGAARMPVFKGVTVSIPYKDREGNIQEWRGVLADVPKELITSTHLEFTEASGRVSKLLSCWIVEDGGKVEAFISLDQDMEPRTLYDSDPRLYARGDLGEDTGPGNQLPAAAVVESDSEHDSDDESDASDEGDGAAVQVETLADVDAPAAVEAPAGVEAPAEAPARALAAEVDAPAEAPVQAGAQAEAPEEPIDLVDFGVFCCSVLQMDF